MVNNNIQGRIMDHIVIFRYKLMFMDQVIHKLFEVGLIKVFSITLRLAKINNILNIYI